MDTILGLGQKVGQPLERSQQGCLFSESSKLLFCLNGDEQRKPRRHGNVLLVCPADTAGASYFVLHHSSPTHSRTRISSLLVSSRFRNGRWTAPFQFGRVVHLSNEKRKPSATRACCAAHSRNTPLDTMFDDFLRGEEIACRSVFAHCLSVQTRQQPAADHMAIATTVSYTIHCL
jgi:hypothetical protein